MEVSTENSQTTAVTTETQAAPSSEQIQIQELERMAFGGPRQEQQTQSSETTTQQAESGTAAAPAATTDNNPAEELFDESVYLKNNFGWETKESALAEIQELRKLKESNQGFKFENEESEKLARAINLNPKEAFKILEKQERIDSLLSLEINKDNASNIIKMGIELANPDLSPEEVEFQYKQDYTTPKEPVQKATEDDDEFAERHNEWKEKAEAIEMKRTIAAKMAKPQLVAAKQKIDLSTILNTAPVDKDYESYKASLQSDLEFEQKVVIPAIQALTEDKIKISVDVNDANNKMQFGVSITPDKSDFDAAKQDALGFDKFISSVLYDKDGKFNPENQALAIMKIKHFDKYMQSAARQAVNAERARVLAEETKGGGSQRDFNTTHVEPTELQRLERMAFGNS